MLPLAGRGLLIGHHRYRTHDIPSLEDVRQQVFGGDHPAAEAGAHLLHLAFRPAVHERFVRGIEGKTELQRQAQQHPFPVALVRSHQQH